jgi:hypothetical protein
MGGRLLLEPRAEVAIMAVNHRIMWTITGMATAKTSKYRSLIQPAGGNYVQPRHIFQCPESTCRTTAGPVFAAGREVPDGGNIKQFHSVHNLK